MVRKTLTIQPDGGVVAGGTASYSVDTDTGAINYSVNLIAHYLFSNHAMNSSGVYKVDPALLKSANVKAGETINLGFVEIHVDDVLGKTAHAHASVKDYADGIAVISLKNDIIEIENIDAKGTVMGMNFTLVLK